MCVDERETVGSQVLENKILEEELKDVKYLKVMDIKCWKRTLLEREVINIENWKGNGWILNTRRESDGY